MSRLSVQLSSRPLHICICGIGELHPGWFQVQNVAVVTGTPTNFQMSSLGHPPISRQTKCQNQPRDTHRRNRTESAFGMYGCPRSDRTSLRSWVSPLRSHASWLAHRSIAGTHRLHFAELAPAAHVASDAQFMRFGGVHGYGVPSRQAPRPCALACC